ncbi:MAG: helix-turn-helix transcriptional regulator [Burkholderiaceae bacterium]
MDIASRLKAERERLGLSQTAFGAVGDAGKTTVIGWERGTAFPNAAFLAQVAELGVDVRYVITGSRDYEPPEGLKPDEQVLLDYYRAASREIRNAAMGVLIGAQPGAPRQVFHGKVGTAVAGDLKTLNLNKRPKG